VAVAQAEPRVQTHELQVARQRMVLEAVVEQEHLGAEGRDRAQPQRRAIGARQHRHAGRARREQTRLVPTSAGDDSRRSPAETTFTSRLRRPPTPRDNNATLRPRARSSRAKNAATGSWRSPPRPGSHRHHLRVEPRARAPAQVVHRAVYGGARRVEPRGQVSGVRAARRAADSSTRHKKRNSGTALASRLVHQRHHALGGAAVLFEPLRGLARGRVALGIQPQLAQHALELRGVLDRYSTPYGASSACCVRWFSTCGP